MAKASERSSVDLRALTGNITPLASATNLSVNTNLSISANALRRDAVNLMGELGESSSLDFVTSTDLESYMQLIRQLAKDSDDYDRFVSQLKASMNAAQGDPAEMESQMMEAIQGQTSQGQATQGQTSQGQAAASTQAASASQSASIRVEAEVKFTREERIELKTKEGDPQRFLQLRYNGEKFVSAEIVTAQQGDPLVFDLDGNGIELTDVAGGVRFDLMMEGRRSQTAFVSGEDAFLALDRNQNGAIDDGGELFGDQHGAEDGFVELRKFDENQDGVIDRNDSVFNELRLFSDHNRDGVSQASELRSLTAQGIQSIVLDGVKAADETINGNALIAQGRFIRTDGSVGLVGDVMLNYLV